jgi:hypothetical protein
MVRVRRADVAERRSFPEEGVGSWFPSLPTARRSRPEHRRSSAASARSRPRRAVGGSPTPRSPGGTSTPLARAATLARACCTAWGAAASGVGVAGTRALGADTARDRKPPRWHPRDAQAHLVLGKALALSMQGVYTRLVAVPERPMGTSGCPRLRREDSWHGQRAAASARPPGSRDPGGRTAQVPTSRATASRISSIPKGFATNATAPHASTATWTAAGWAAVIRTIGALPPRSR